MRYRWIIPALVMACGGGGDRATPEGDRTERGFEPPVVTNAESPVAYPLAAYQQRIEGTVVLRLFVDERGGLVPDSTQIAEGSGNTALDSAALAGVAGMRFAPARQDGTPVATAFIQPVHFRLPDGS